jgi:PadR family transcriptional regulator, regulatory protein AphA
VKSKTIKLTTTSYALLALLDQLGEATSYDIKQALDKSIENFWPVPHTTAYEEPARLAEGGYLSVLQESGGRRRKSYSLTEEGRRALRGWADEPSAAPPQLRDELALKIFAGTNPTPLVEERIAWHRAKLVELQGYLDAVRSVEGYEGSERSLVAGLAYHRKMIEMIEELLDQVPQEAGR